MNIGIRTDDPDKVGFGDLLGGVNYYRLTQTLSDFDENKPYTVYNNLYDKGKKVLQNVNWTSQSPTPFFTDIVTYTVKLERFIELLGNNKPEVLVIENEETNESYYTGPVEDYITLLSTAINIAHSYGIAVTNGGLTIRVLTWLVYKDLVLKGKTDRALKFAQHCIPDVELRALNKPGTNPVMDQKISDGKKLVAAYKSLPLDYVNIHFYEPVKYRNTATAEDIVDADVHATPHALGRIVKYLKRETGKDVMSNEMGQLNDSGIMVTEMLENAENMEMPYVIWETMKFTNGYNNNESVPLDPAGENGLAFKKVLISLNN